MRKEQNRKLPPSPRQPEDEPFGIATEDAAAYEWTTIRLLPAETQRLLTYLPTDTAAEREAKLAEAKRLIANCQAEIDRLLAKGTP